MRCNEFRDLYEPFMESFTGEVLRSKRYGRWVDHMNACEDCGDWYQLKQVESWGADVSQYPCVHVAYNSVMHCTQHDNAWECPDTALVRVGDVFGIPVRDGGPSFLQIKHCPWCGIRLSSDELSPASRSAARRRGGR